MSKVYQVTTDIRECELRLKSALRDLHTEEHALRMYMREKYSEQRSLEVQYEVRRRIRKIKALEADLRFEEQYIDYMES